MPSASRTVAASTLLDSNSAARPPAARSAYSGGVAPGAAGAPSARPSPNSGEPPESPAGAGVMPLLARLDPTGRTRWVVRDANGHARSARQVGFFSEPLGNRGAREVLPRRQPRVQI